MLYLLPWKWKNKSLKSFTDYLKEKSSTNVYANEFIKLNAEALALFEQDIQNFLSIYTWVDVEINIAYREINDAYREIQNKRQNIDKRNRSDAKVNPEKYFTSSIETMLSYDQTQFDAFTAPFLDPNAPHIRDVRPELVEAIKNCSETPRDSIIRKILKDEYTDEKASMIQDIHHWDPLLDEDEVQFNQRKAKELLKIVWLTPDQTRLLMELGVCGKHNLLFLRSSTNPEASTRSFYKELQDLLKISSLSATEKINLLWLYRNISTALNLWIEKDVPDFSLKTEEEQSLLRNQYYHKIPGVKDTSTLTDLEKSIAKKTQQISDAATICKEIWTQHTILKDIGILLI